MKIDRLIGIIMILLQKEKVTAPELAERFEVTRRTISRDIEDICKAGIPVVTTQGKGGGIAIEESYKVSKTFFTREELQQIFTGIRGLDSISKAPIRKKLEERLPGGGKQIAIDEIIVIDLASHYYGSLSEKIACIKEAAESHHLISFDYYYEKGEQRRIVEPYRLLFRWSSWYLFGYCTEKNAFRLFKLNRLWNISMLEERFSARKVPDEELKVDDYFSANKNYRLKAIFDTSVKYRLIEEYGVDCFTVSNDGGLVFERDFAGYEYMLQWVLSFGDKVRIIAPEKLQRDRMCQVNNILAQTENFDET